MDSEEKLKIVKAAALIGIEKLIESYPDDEIKSLGYLTQSLIERSCSSVERLNDTFDEIVGYSRASSSLEYRKLCKK